MAKGITVRELADAYFTVHCTHPVTQKSGRYHIRPVLRLVGGWQARRLKPQHISEFMEGQRQLGVSLATAVLRAKLLLTILRWGVGTGRLVSNPLEGYAFPGPGHGGSCHPHWPRPGACATWLRIMWRASSRWA